MFRGKATNASLNVTEEIKIEVYTATTKVRKYKKN